MKREMISIDEEKCNGCGLCIPNCHEGALQLIDGKARLISDLMCDGLGACIGHCPEGAITLEIREAQPYDEVKVMSQMIKKGKNTLIAHFKHLSEHGEKEYLAQGISYMLDNRHEMTDDPDEVLEALNAPARVHAQNQHSKNMSNHMNHSHHDDAQGCGCQGSQTRTFVSHVEAGHPASASQPSALSHWPVQMHLINPSAGHFVKSHLLLAADCTAFTLGAFHRDHLAGKTLAIACPKLDSNRESYVDKLITLIDQAEIDMMTVMIMEVPCCGGLVQLVDMALGQSKRKIPVKLLVISVDGNIKQERWHKVA